MEVSLERWGLNIAYKSMDLASSLQQQQIQQVLLYSIFLLSVVTGPMVLIRKPYIF